MQTDLVKPDSEFAACPHRTAHTSGIKCDGTLARASSEVKGNKNQTVAVAASAGSLNKRNIISIPIPYAAGTLCQEKYENYGFCLLVRAD